MSMNKQITLDLRERVHATDYLDYKDYLQAIYLHLKKSEERYSYIQFGEDLGFSRSNVMHLVTKGARPLTLKAAIKIAAALGLTGAQRRYFEALVAYQHAKSPQKREELFQDLLKIKSKTLDSDAAKNLLDFFSEWYHTAIYELTQLPAFVSDGNWLADNIEPRIRPEQAKKGLALLEDLGLISFDETKGRHFPTQARVSTGDEIASMAIVRYHQRMIEIGRETITRVIEDQRDISSVTISLPLEALSRFKEEISIFRKKILALADNLEDKDSVYQMNIQLFPLTKQQKSEGEE